MHEPTAASPNAVFFGGKNIGSCPGCDAMREAKGF
jgi:hypothetical protein